MGKRYDPTEITLYDNLVKFMEKNKISPELILTVEYYKQGVKCHCKWSDAEYIFKKIWIDPASLYPEISNKIKIYCNGYVITRIACDCSDRWHIVETFPKTLKNIVAPQPEDLCESGYQSE